MFKDALKGKSLLLVEDEMIIALDLRWMLERQGANVSVAYDFHRGMEKADQPLDAAILDGKLSSENSLPIAKKLSDRGVGVVFHSGTVIESDARAVHPKAKFLTKPAADIQIVASLLEVINPCKSK